MATATAEAVAAVHRPQRISKMHGAGNDFVVVDLRDGLVRTRDQYYYVPLHHQMRPWAMKKTVSISYSPDDRPTARFAVVK